MQGTVGNFNAGQGPALPILISQSFKVEKKKQVSVYKSGSEQQPGAKHLLNSQRPE